MDRAFITWNRVSAETEKLARLGKIRLKILWWECRKGIFLLFFFLSLYVFFKLTREDEFLSVSFFSLSFLLSRECNVVHISRAMVIERNFCFLFFFIFFQRNVLNLNETARARIPPRISPRHLSPANETSSRSGERRAEPNLGHYELSANWERVLVSAESSSRKYRNCMYVLMLARLLEIAKFFSSLSIARKEREGRCVQRFITVATVGRQEWKKFETFWKKHSRGRRD